MSREISFRRRDAIVAGLVLLFVAALSWASQGRLQRFQIRHRSHADEGVVNVLSAAIEPGREYLEVVFDQPIGQDLLGASPSKALARITPHLVGHWEWIYANTVRFFPDGGFPIASAFVMVLDEDLLPLGDRTLSQVEFTVQTDLFMVRSAFVSEEPVPDSREPEVFLTGHVEFNYTVEARTLIEHLALSDPDGPMDVVPITLTSVGRSSMHTFRSEKPLRKQDAARELTLLVDSGLGNTEGSALLTSEFRLPVALGSRLHWQLTGVQPASSETESSIDLQFSSPLDASTLTAKLKVTPKVEYTLAASGNTASLRGSFAPGTVYRVSIPAGTAARDGSTLAQAVDERILVPDLEPLLAFQAPGMFLASSGKHQLVLETINVEQIHVSVDRAYLNNLVHVLDDYSWEIREGQSWGDSLRHQFGDRVADEDREIKGKRNVRQRTKLDLDKLVKDPAPGFYRVAVTEADDWESTVRWVLVSDLGLAAKLGPRDLMVWAASFKDLSPVANAEVTVVSDQNQVLATGRTDGRGLLMFSDLPRLFKGKAPALVTIRSGNDSSFLPLEFARVSTNGLDVGGASSGAQAYSAFLFGERDIYRPGETLQGVGLLRDRSLAVPPDMPVLLKHRDPEGREFARQRLNVRNGIVPFSESLPSSLRTGHHALDLLAGENVIGTWNFQVEEFVPDRIRVEIKPAKNVVSPPDALSFRVNSAYLFGAPAARLAVEARVRIEERPFAPEAFAGWTFGDATQNFPAQDVLEEEGTLDANGDATFEVNIPAAIGATGVLNATITARVQEQGGRGVSARTAAEVRPFPVYIGMKQDSPSVEPRKAATFGVAGVAPDGKARALPALRIEIYQDDWHTVMRRGSDGAWRYESTVSSRLVHTTAVPAGKERATFTYTPAKYGGYHVIATDPASTARTRLDFYSGGWGDAAWAMKDPGRIELTLDKAEYAPGETATVDVKSPFGGALLLTVEREGVFYTTVQTMTGNTARVNVPVPAEARPNAYVTALVVRGMGSFKPGEASRAFGAVPIAVDREANRLDLQVTAVAEMRPRNPLAVEVSAAPGAAVTLAAVDEGILQLVAQKTADPFGFFYRKQALDTRTHDTFALLFPESVSGRARAGGGEALAGLNQFARTDGIRRAKPVSFFAGPVTADAAGMARFTFDVPDFQGAVRLMAVAASGARFGSAERFVRIKDPVVVMATAPRFLAFGDVSALSLTVRNDTPRDGTFALTADLEGPAEWSGKKPASLEIPKGAERTAQFFVKARPETGDVRVRFSASGNGQTTRAESLFPVQPDLPAVVQVQTGALAAETTFTAADATFVPGSVTRSLRVSRMPALQFSAQMRYLLHYPWGCIEQTVSTSMPLLYFSDLAKEVAPEVLKGRNPEALVDAGIARVATMQLNSGAFGYWPGDDRPYAWGTVWATHFLLEAKEAGHGVGDYVLNPALAYLQANTRVPEQMNPSDVTLTAYNLYVLAHAGRADLGTMDALRDRVNGKFPMEARALLGAAYGAAGNRPAMEALFAGLADVPETTRDTAGILGSPVRNRAIVLMALAESAPNDPRIPALTGRLAREATTGWWWNTHESAWTFLALGRMARRQAALGDYAGTLSAGGRELGNFRNADRTFAGLPSDQPLTLRAAPGVKDGAAFWALQTRGVPRAESFRTEREGLTIHRDLFLRNGAALTPAGVTQGDLVVMRVRVSSQKGPLDNVAVQMLLPAGLEVENPRLSSTETLPWVNTAPAASAYMDLRDDQVVLFTSLPGNGKENTYYALLRAVSAGVFTLPPARAEAMYDPSIHAVGSREALIVHPRP